MNEINKLQYFESVFNYFQVEITHQQLSQVAHYFKLKLYKKGEHVIFEGDKFPLVAFIQKGLARMYINTLEGKEYISAFFLDGQLFMNFNTTMENKASDYSTQVLEDSYIYVADFLEINNKYKHEMFWLLLKEKFYKHNFMVKVHREKQLLTYDTKKRYKKLKEERPELLKRASQQNIALYLGVTPVALNRVIKSFEKN